LVSVDFFTVPTAAFRILYVFLVLRHERREVVHFNVTEHPTAQWTAQQMIEAFPWDPAPQYLLRDRDKTYGASFRRRVHSLDMKEVLTAPGSPWQNPYVERLIGSIRRECLDHVIVFNELHSSDFFAPTFLTITRRERILRWTNNVQNKDRSNSLTWERSSPSRTSAVCIMSTAAPPDTRSQRP
jgi:transposase InsO family protein